MKRSKAVLVTVPFILAMGACASEPEYEDTDYSAVCVQQATQVRVDDDQCSDDMDNSNSSSPLLWYFIGRSMSAPAVGSHVTGGSHVKPATGSVGTAPRTGGFGTRVGAGS